MTAAYNRRPGVRQPPDGVARSEAIGPAGLAADLLLLASCAAADRAAEARVERRLREEALRFIAAGPHGAVDEARRSLQRLLEEAAADHAAALVVGLAGGETQQLLAAGSGPGAALWGPVPETMCAGIRVAVRTGRALEAPSVERAAPIPSLPQLLAEAGVSTLRWSCRSLGGDQAFVVALHAGGEARYWTPIRQQFHDGVTDVLAAALLVRGLAGPATT